MRGVAHRCDLGIILSSHPFAKHYAVHDQAIRDGPFPVQTLADLVANTGTIEDVRHLFTRYYEEHYGREHAVVAALADPETNYYRIDSALAIQYAAIDPGRPLMVHLRNFIDDAPRDEARAWRTAREKFIAYYGCDVDVFVDAVQRGFLVVTMHDLEAYQGSFMREVFETLHRLPEEKRPVNGRVVETSWQLQRAAETPGHRTTWYDQVMQDLDKVRGAGRFPALTQQRYTVQRAGPSRLPAVEPYAFLQERFMWFDMVLPGPGKDILQRMVRSLRKHPTRPRLDLLMQSVQAFQSLFQAAVLYSRGSSVRVCDHDITTISARLEDIHDFTQGLHETHKRWQRLLHWGADRIDDIQDPLNNLLATRVPLVAEEPLDKADKAIRRIVPRCLGSQRAKKILDTIDRWLDKEQETEADLVAGRAKIQARLCDDQADTARGVEIAQQVDEVGERIEAVMGLSKRLDLAQSETCHAGFRFGGNLAATFLPSLRPAFRVVDTAWKAANRFRFATIDGEVRRAMNPNLKIRLDPMQVHGPAWAG